MLPGTRRCVTGLLLFAFDGTSNADTDGTEERTNVVHFRDAYRGDEGELDTGQDRAGGDSHWYYMTGAGRDDPRSGLDAGFGQPDTYNRDLLDGNATGERVLLMARYLFTYLNKLEAAEQDGQLPPETLNLDIVGFSRGAAEARVFANLVDRFLAGDDEFMVVNGVTRNAVADFTSASVQRARDYLDGCTAPSVNLRFLGLWDTVSHLGAWESNDAKASDGDANDAWLTIPKRVNYTAQAVAVNERRAIFDAWSIHDSPGQSDGNTIERGFVGAHSDISGGYEDSDLSDVAFTWMVQQAIENGGLPKEAIDMGVYLRAELPYRH